MASEARAILAGAQRLDAGLISFFGAVPAQFLEMFVIPVADMPAGMEMNAHHISSQPLFIRRA